MPSKSSPAATPIPPAALAQLGQVSAELNALVVATTTLLLKSQAGWEGSATRNLADAIQLLTVAQHLMDSALLTLAE